MRGYVHPDFEPVREALRFCVPARRPGGASVSVFHRGRLVVDLATGTRNEQGDPFETDTLSLSMSTTKGVAATALHVLVDRGIVELDSPVARYWPRFARNGKGATTVRQALAHQAGLHAIEPLIERFEDMYDWERMIRALEDATPLHVPGEDYGYHAFTFGWLVGEIARRALGVATYPEVIAELLSRPLGLDGLFVGVPDSELHRASDMVGPRSLPPVPRPLGRAFAKTLGVGAKCVGANVEFHESELALFPPGISRADLNARAFRQASLPAVNGHFDARSLAKLYAALAGDGSIDGVRLVSPRTLEEARADHNGYFTVCRVIPFPLRVKLGYHRAISLGLRFPFLGKSFDVGVASPNSFGHFGFGGSGAWADPDRELAVGLTTNTFFGRVPLDLRTVLIATAAAHSVDRSR